MKANGACAQLAIETIDLTFHIENYYDGKERVRLGSEW